MPGIFISYRRTDTSGQAGRLADDLAERFGRSSLFMDIDSIPVGVNFEERIQQALNSCEVALVLVGKRWISTRSKGKRRIEQDDDYVRKEIAAALAREDVRVIPVLVEGARMPQPTELPSDIARLAKINALELNNSHWQYDLTKLSHLVQPRRSRRILHQLRGPAWRLRIALAAAVAALAVVALVLLLGGGGSGPAHLAAFQTPSNNIHCSMSTTAARCDIGQRYWSPTAKPSSCRAGWGRGLTVTSNGPARFVCANDSVVHTTNPVLEYDKDSQVGRFTCQSRRTGMTCRDNSTRHYFFLSRERYSLS